jgi:hypothetical protein
MNIAEEIAGNSYILVKECSKFLVKQLDKGNLITPDGSKYNPAKRFNFGELMQCYLVDCENKDIQMQLPNAVLEWVCFQLGTKDCKSFRPEQTRDLVRKLMIDNSNQNLIFMLFNLVFESFHTEANKDK